MFPRPIDVYTYTRQANFIGKNLPLGIVNKAVICSVHVAAANIDCCARAEWKFGRCSETASYCIKTQCQKYPPKSFVKSQMFAANLSGIKSQIIEKNKKKCLRIIRSRFKDTKRHFISASGDSC